MEVPQHDHNHNDGRLTLIMFANGLLGIIKIAVIGFWAWLVSMQANDAIKSFAGQDTRLNVAITITASVAVGGAAFTVLMQHLRGRSRVKELERVRTRMQALEQENTRLSDLVKEFAKSKSGGARGGK